MQKRYYSMEEKHQAMKEYLINFFIELKIFL
jgi:hypothetical protein